MTLSREHGVGCVALGNTNHWMRGGTYGWQSAEAGLIGICWTDHHAEPGPPWGPPKNSGPGNNPLVIAVPRAKEALVLDLWRYHQFSYGALESYRRRKAEKLPVDGGFDREGNA